MDVQHLKAELNHHQMEWNELEADFDKTEEKILDYIRTSQTEKTVKHFEILKDIENKMRPIRNNLIFVYENLAQASHLKGNPAQENEYKTKAADFYKNRYSRNERRIQLIGILNRNGIMI